VGGAVPHKTWVELSAAALDDNLQNLHSVLAPGVEFCAVVKANAYGHGLKEIVRLASRFNLQTFAVDSLDEANLVRSLLPSATIIILGFTLPERFLEVVQGQYVQTVYDVEAIHALREAARSLALPARVNIKLETGLHRQGVDARELDTLIEALKVAGDSVLLYAVGSHFANSEDQTRADYTAQQMQIFEQQVLRITGAGLEPRFAHMACSAAALTRPESHYNLVRFGIALYGHWPSAGVRRQVTLGRTRLDLSPVLSWRTTVAQVKQVAPGAQIGYGGVFTANRPMRIAVLPVGYYDGYDRSLGNRAEVIIRGSRCAVLGNICMNMLMVDVSTVPAAKTGDIVTLIGRDGMHAITAEDLAERAGTINYEIITRINPSLPRVII
jgi:alanine racemase